MHIEEFLQSPVYANRTSSGLVNCFNLSVNECVRECVYLCVYVTTSHSVGWFLDSEN